MRTQFSSSYLEFRRLLKNDELQMFQQTLRILAHGGMEEGKLLEIRAPDVSPRFSIYVIRQGQELLLLGGHWLRKGEPSREFLDDMNKLVRDAREGRRLG
jgi:hypothetical protein